MSEPVSKVRSVLVSVAPRNICIEVEFGGTIVVLVLDVMEQVSECVCDDADVSRLPQCQLIQLDQVILSARSCVVLLALAQRQVHDEERDTSYARACQANSFISKR